MFCNTLNGLFVFPVHAGMNRLRGGVDERRRSIPRTRGDEPAVILKATEGHPYSPYTRG